MSCSLYILVIFVILRKHTTLTSQTKQKIIKIIDIGKKINNIATFYGCFIINNIRVNCDKIEKFIKNKDNNIGFQNFKKWRLRKI